MVKRIGIAVWWIGTIWAVAFVAVGLLLSTEPAMCIGMGAIGLIPAWTLSFILAGSFLRPPK